MTDMMIPRDTTPSEDSAQDRPLVSGVSALAANPRRRGRPRRDGGSQTGNSLPHGHTVKRYDLGPIEQRTASSLRSILAQRHIPGHATVSVEHDALTLEWDD